MSFLKSAFVFCCMSIGQSIWASDAFEAKNDAGECYTVWKDDAIKKHGINLPERLKESVNVVLRNMVQQCFNREESVSDGTDNKFVGEGIIDYPNPEKFSDANWNYVLMANYMKFSVWGNQRYGNDYPTAFEINLNNLYGDDTNELYTEEEFYKQSGPEKKLIWLRSNERGIELMGEILEKYYEKYYKDQITDLHNKIQRTISYCKIYAQQLELFDCMNEIKLHEATKSLANVSESTYHLSDLVKDREAFVYMLDRSRETFEPCSRCIKAGTAENQKRFIVCGDLHGDFYSLGAVLCKYAKDVADGNLSLAFLGDYIDRGPHSLEVLSALLTLKRAFPDRVLMISGNHEAEGYCDEWGLISGMAHAILRHKNNESAFSYEMGIVTSMDDLGLSQPWRQGEYYSNYCPCDGTITAALANKIFDVFDYLPIYMRLNGNILCVHGSLPVPSINTMAFDNSTQGIRINVTPRGIGTFDIEDGGMKVYRENAEKYVTHMGGFKKFRETKLEAAEKNPDERIYWSRFKTLDEHLTEFSANQLCNQNQMMLWSDVVQNDFPANRRNLFWTLKTSARGATFGLNIPIAVIEEVLKANNANILVKGHQHNEKYDVFGPKIFNIVTTSYFDEEDICGNPIRDASILEITTDGKCNRLAVKGLIDNMKLETYITKNLGWSALLEAEEWLDIL